MMVMGSISYCILCVCVIRLIPVAEGRTAGSCGRSERLREDCLEALGRALLVQLARRVHVASESVHLEKANGVIYFCQWQLEV